MTSDLLAAMVAAARRSADERAKISGPAERAPAAQTVRGAAFYDSLRRPGIRVIAECKRRSPSRGILRAEYDPAAIARSYETAGAAAISVLTEPAFFDGSLDHLSAVRTAVSAPILRKDFIVSRFQIDEARAAGADAVLLIVAALDDRLLRELIAHASDQGLAALVETHDREEFLRAREARAVIIGVNSRNLRSLEMNQTVFDDVAPLLTADVVGVAESGLKTAADLQRLQAMGYRAFLIGERFMASPDPGAALGDLLRSAEDAGGDTR